MKKYYYYSLLTFIIFTIISCQKNDLPNVEYSEQSQPTILLNEIAVIGEKLPNPYSIENMRKAYENIKSRTKTSSPEDLQATHHYIKFIPKSEVDLIEIQNLDALELFLYPLDHEVSDGRIDVDPNYSVNGFQHRWAYVPIGYDLAGLKCEYEVLYDIYSPMDDIQTRSIGSDFCDELEKEAHRLCGMELEEVPQTKASKVTPGGRITFWDNHTNSYVGCKGLSVQAVRLTHSSYGHCDENGYFTIDDSFKYKFSYQIHFSRTDFIVRRNDNTSEVVYKYSGYLGDITKTFGPGDEATFFARITRAGVLYYYENIDNLRRPPFKSDKNTGRLAIHANLSNDLDYLGLFTYNGRFIFSDRPIIKVYQKDKSGAQYNHRDVFATTIHELTHAAHWRVDRDAFYATDDNVVESLARGVEWYLTNKEYISSTYNPQYYRQTYTGVIPDLVDGYGTTTSYWYGYWNGDGEHDTTVLTKSYYDKVAGYTVSEIEEAALKSKTWEQWYENIYSDTSKSDRNYVQDVFNYWDSI